MTLYEILKLAVDKQQAGKLTESQAICHQILRQQPNQANTLNLLGILSHQLNDIERAIDYFRRAAAADPSQALYHQNLGRLLIAMGRWSQAADAYRAAQTVAPNDLETLKNLGRALHHSGKLHEAAGVYRAALAINPNDAAVLNNLGGASKTAEESIEYFQKAIALEPNFALAHSNLANSLAFVHRIDDSIQSARRAIELDPKLSGAYNNLGHCLFVIARLDEAIDCFYKSEELDPKNLNPSCNRLFCLQFHPDYDGPKILRECRLWDEHYARPLAPKGGTYKNVPDPDRKLRIGYVSPNFFAHSQAPFLVPLFRNHDRDRFELYCYSNSLSSDATTAALKACAAQWRDVAGAPDTALAEMVMRDQIDILVDLTMHMARGRPLMFARKPAPIQVAYLAYPGTTGMPAMDYRLTDAQLDPPGETDGHYCETSVRLPQTFACFDPAAIAEPPPVSPLPALANGYVTFGSLNSYFKLNPALLAVWARILEATPGSRLRLLAPEGSAREWATKYLPADRVDFLARMSRNEYLAEFSRIDICLDTLPYNGHTTSLEALYQGVPVVTRRGITASGRAGASLMHNLRMPELVAETDDQFVQIAADLARDLPRLADLRKTLRQRVSESPLTDAPAFARRVEEAYRQMWTAWCTTSSQRNPATALNEQGNRLCQSGDFTAAIACYRQALAANPGHVPSQNNLANALASIGKWAEANEGYQRALAHAPDSPDILRNIAKSCVEQNQIDQAIAWLDKLLAIHPDDALAHVHRGLALLLKGDLPDGLAEYDWRWRSPQLNMAFQPPGTVWDGGPLAGKPILLHAEQGLGDAIQCLRFVPEVAKRGGRIILAIPGELRRLAEGIAPIDHWIVEGESPPEYDLHCPLLGLPRALGTTLATIPADVPYLAARPELQAAWKSRLPQDASLKVGLVWSGHPGHQNDRQRSIPLALLAPPANIAAAKFFSLQKGPAADQAKNAPMDLTDFTADLHDFADTAALVAVLDLVICVDTAVAHLAGAMGKPTWLLLPFAPDWRWLLNRTDSPWYPTMRIFRQPAHGDWATPVGQIADALRELTVKR